MVAVKYQALTESFIEFAAQADRFIHIRSPEDYLQTLDLIEELMESADDAENDPRNDLIGVLANSVHAYEALDSELAGFHALTQASDPAVATLRLLMDQYSLTPADLKEDIGSKSLVSMILSGKRALTKEHIANLSARFNLNPAVFFPKWADTVRGSAASSALELRR